MIYHLARWRFRSRLIDTVRDMPVLARAVFIDHARRGLSYEEIAARHSLEPQDVKLLLRSVLAELDAVLHPDDGE